nr:MAG TPA: hypothetical protein [Caudoviricetes sp.]
MLKNRMYLKMPIECSSGMNTIVILVEQLKICVPL